MSSLSSTDWTPLKGGGSRRQTMTASGPGPLIKPRPIEYRSDNEACIPRTPPLAVHRDLHVPLTPRKATFRRHTPIAYSPGEDDSGDESSSDVDDAASDGSGSDENDSDGPPESGDDDPSVPATHPSRTRVTRATLSMLQGGAYLVGKAAITEYRALHPVQGAFMTSDESDELAADCIVDACTAQNYQPTPREHDILHTLVCTFFLPLLISLVLTSVVVM